MAGIFVNQNTAHKGSMSSDEAVMSISGSTEDTAIGIVQNVNLQFGQQVSRIYDVTNGGGGSTTSSGGVARAIVPVYYVGGRTQGNATIARVLGPQIGSLCAIYQQLSDICVPKTLNFTFGAGCGTGRNAMSYTAEGSVLTNITLGVAAQDMIVNENMQIMFANLTCN